MRTVLAAALMLVFASGALAQENAPFDMSPERPAQSTPPENPAAQPDEAVPVPVEPAPPSEPVQFSRFLLPDDKVTLAGEQARRNWAIYLSPRQAASAATLTFGYQNAVVVAPESSQLSVVVNGTEIHEEQVAAPDGVVSRQVAIPAGVLRAGRNEIGFAARHRHRTDCTIESTYELWTEIVGSGTYLSFTDPAAAELATAEDLSAVGGDADGKVHITIIAPALSRLDIATDIMRLSQALARHINTPDIEISVTSARALDQPQADLVVLLGGAEDLSSLGYGLPSIDSSYSAFLRTPAGQAPVFLVSGRDRAQWGAALDSLVTPVDRSIDIQRDVYLTEAWRTPNAKMFFVGKQVPFADMGLRSEQFSGRRYTAEFEFGVPSDFYAEAYGEARILLDAAYSDEIEPGSLINIYVNGSVAASMPITTTQGAVLNRFPINFTMQHVRPGLNRVVLEADLRTAADEVCSPGSAADAAPRFALFETSRFDIPTFARIAQRPNLSALAGTSFPYGRSLDPIAIMVDRSTEDGLSGLATLLARMARSAGRILPIEFVASPEGLGMRNAIIMGGATDIPQNILAQVGVSIESGTDWETGSGSSGSPVPGGPTLDEWRLQVTGSWFGRTWRDFREWLQRTFNITSDMLRFMPEEETAYVPPPSTGLVIAQSGNPAGTGTWTVVVAPDKPALRANLAAFTDLRNWNRLSGHITAFNPATREVDIVPVGQFELVETVPPSIWNYRLVAANWLSANILSYSLALILACVVLGAATTLLLGSLGRRR